MKRESIINWCPVLNSVFPVPLEFHQPSSVDDLGWRRGKVVYRFEESFFSPDRKNSRGGYGVAIAESPHLFTGVRQYPGKWRPRAALYHPSERLRSSSRDFYQKRWGSAPSPNVWRHGHHSYQGLDGVDGSP